MVMMSIDGMIHKVQTAKFAHDVLLYDFWGVSRR